MILHHYEPTAEDAMSQNTQFIPITPAGTPCIWLASRTEQEAWEKLLIHASHMPYDGKQGFKERGYTVEEFTEDCYIEESCHGKS